MIRVDRVELTRKEIIRVATNFFLKDGYSKTTFRAMGQALNMSTGNITFHFQTKEHMLAELVDMLCEFQWKMMEEASKDGNPFMALCLELLSMAAACEQDEVIKEFFLASYTSPLTLEIIRKNDMERAERIFGEYCSDWPKVKYSEVATLLSGVEYATLMTTDTSPPLEHRIRGALRLILTVYNVPEDIREEKIAQALEVDYRELGRRIPEAFRDYVDKETEHALVKLLERKIITK